MRKEDTLRLHTHSLGRRIEELGIKQWWLARQLKVDRKTVGRWISGKVKRVARENLEALARELDCRLEELTLSDEADAYATREEQRAAARILQERDLLGLLAPTDDWRMAESLIKATMEPNLPIRSLGHLYNLLSTTAWRQGNYLEGEERARRAREIGEQCDDRGIQMKALLNLATIHSLVGPLETALSEFEACLKHRAHFDDEREYGKTLSNVAWLHREAGDLDRCLETQRQSVQVFMELGASYNLAISWTSMGLHHTELGDYAQALEAIETARAHARDANYERGHVCCDFYEADVHTLRGDYDRARQLIERARPGLARYQVYDLTCLEITARFYRRVGDLEQAEEEIERGVAAAAPFPTLLVSMLLEAARIAQVLERPERARNHLERALRIAVEHGMPKRVRRGSVAEYGSGAVPTSG